MHGSQKRALGVLLGLVAIVAMFDIAQGADFYIALRWTQFYLYAPGPGEWVRDHTAYTYDALRTADGISKSEATLFMAYNETDINAAIPFARNMLNLYAVDMPHPWCYPSNGTVGAWQNTTVVCLDDTRKTARFQFMSVSSTDPYVRAGDAIYIKDVASGLFCTANSWPTNQAGITCASPTAGPTQVFHIEI